MQRYIFLIILIIFLFLRLFFYLEEQRVLEPGDTLSMEYTLLKEPKSNNISQYFFTNNVLVTLPLHPKYEYADRIKIEGKVEQSKDEKILIVKNPKVRKIGSSDSFLAVSKFIRQRVENSVLVVLPTKDGGLLLGIILGIRDKIPNDYYKQMRSVGLLHVVAASGQNISIVASLILLGFERITKRRTALLLTSTAILFYAFLTGFDPPIVRASIMAIVAFGALFLGKQNIAILSLILTLFVMLIINPSSLLDVSFQLSAMSTAGILTLKPILDRTFGFKFLSLLKDDITTTLSSQIATIPIMFASFGSYSLLSFFVNVAVLWTVPFLMVFGGIGAILSLILPVLSLPFFLIAEPFLFFFRILVNFGASFPSNITFENLQWTLVVGYYLLVLSLIIKFSSSKDIK